MVVHDHLESENNQFYFHEFAAALERHGLQYVGDSDIAQMYVENLPAEAAEKLKAVTDILRQEQYMDFIRNRRFRSSIVCPNATEVNRNLRPEVIHDFYLSTSITPDPADLKTESADTRFRDSSGNLVFTAHSKETAELFCMLSESRRPIKSARLIDMVAEKIDGADALALRKLLEDLGLRLALRGVISLRAEAGNYVADISETPEASRLARHQASRQEWTTNAWHEKINHDHFTRALIQMLDGRNSLDEICNILSEQVDKGILGVQLGGKAIADANQRRLVIKQLTENALDRFSQKALLVA
jgi:methyltransferase-like protein